MDHDAFHDLEIDEHISETEQEHDTFDLMGEEAPVDNSIEE